MSDPLPITIPLINPNEPEARLVALHVQEGHRIETGELLCVLETTKSTVELTAESAGFVLALAYAEGDTVKAGEILGYLADQPEAVIPVPLSGNLKPAPDLPTGLRLTRPARELAEILGIDLAALPLDHLVTEAEVRRLHEVLSLQATQVPTVSEAEMDPHAIILYGGGGHAKMLIDLLRSGKFYRIAGILDDGLLAGSQIMGVPVLGGGELLPKLYASGIRQAANGVGGVGNISVRMKVFDKLAQAGFSFPAVVHLSAIIEPSASLAPGAQVFARAYVGGEAQIKFGAIASTGCLISHDCVLEDYSIVSPGAILAGEVRIGSRALVGMGVTINLKVNVGASAKIGNGATVKADVPDHGIVQAGTIWPLS